MTPPLDADSERLLRDLAPQVLAILIRRFHDFAAAEDAMQEALVAAALQWPAGGTPEHPRAWLIQVASRRLTDRIRSDAARRRRETDAAQLAGYLSPAVDAAGDLPGPGAVALPGSAALCATPNPCP